MRSDFDISQPGFFARIRRFWSNTRNRRIIIGLLVGICFAASAVGFYFVFRPEPENPPPPEEKNEEVKEQLYPSPLDGTMVKKEDANRHPLGVMVENHLESRPQSGLSAASIVYEAIAEGGITRFLAIYGPRYSEKIGPVRSARTYFVDWVRELNAYYAHVGGNFDALQKIKAENILDLDQFYNPSAYWRDRSKNVSSEHTMYTSATKLYDIANNKQYSQDNNFVPYKFKDDAAIDQRPNNQTISIDFGNASYNVTYKYQRDSNNYLRELAGKPHIDAETNGQIEVKNIIIMTVKRSATTTAINEHGWAFDLVGSGNASVFIDGQQIEATWKKDNKTARTRFYNKSSGEEINFNRGNFWIEVIHPDLSFKVT